MLVHSTTSFILSVTVALFYYCTASAEPSTSNSTVASNLTIEERLARFEPVKFNVDLSVFKRGDRRAIGKLVAAGKLLNSLYIRQVWSGNPALHSQLRRQGDPKTLRLFELFKRPWDSVENNEPFIRGVPAQPDGANFYPEDMKREEFESWLKSLSAEDKAKAQGFYHVIKRNNKRKLQLKSYAEEYKDLLRPSAALLREAAALVTDASLSRFLSTRAQAFISNDYLPSELNWLNISSTSPLEITCGPYEVYTDGLFSYKAAYEFYLHARDMGSSDLLAKFSKTLADVEAQLPVPEKYKNKDLKAPPIVVVNQLYASGDASVPMTAAYNLPNDEEAIKKGGSKLVIIKNVQEGKYNKTLTLIAEKVIAQDQLRYLSFDAFFTHILLHEVAHSNGPHYVVDSPKETVRSRLQELNSALEEAKADITGLFAAAYLLQRGIITNVSAESFYVTFLASAFRSIRFGLTSAHGRGQAMQLNYLIDQGGFEYDAKTLRFRVNFKRIKDAVQNLTHDILVMQGDGDKARVQAFFDKYAVNRNYTEGALQSLKNVPVDIQPIYSLDR